MRESLSEGLLTVVELGEAVSRHCAYRHLRPVFEEGAGTLIMPLTWQGDMCFARAPRGMPTFQRHSNPTEDVHVTPPSRRDLTPRKANPMIVGGVVCGTVCERATRSW